MFLLNYEVPKNAGKRLMTSIIDETAKRKPEQCFMSIARGSNLDDGLRDISYAEMARAINRCAWWMEQQLGKGVDFPTITTFIDPMDFRHVVLIFGAIKSGYKVWIVCHATRCSRSLTLVQMLYASPRNHLDIQVKLLDGLECNILATHEQMSDVAEKILGKRPMQKLDLPDFGFFLKDEPVQPYPYNKTWEEARKDPYVVMHSSGTTGTPKVLILKNGTAAAHDAFQRFSEFNERP
ncbi:MAG: hypothetical protein Q9160_008865 [Pyrenula sp. 1 TL-2023]